MPYRPRPTSNDMDADVFVEFVGPSSPVSQSPKSLERGIVLAVGDSWARVAWTNSPNILDWPIEWLRGIEQADAALN